MHHRLSLLLLTSMLSAGACTGGEGAFPEDVVFAIERPDGITALAEQNEFPVFYGVAGGYFLRIWLGGDTALACAVEDSNSPCQVQLGLQLQDGSVISEQTTRLIAIGDPEGGWDFLAMVVVNPWQVDREIDELFGLTATLRVELLVNGRSANTQEFAGLFTSALDSF